MGNGNPEAESRAGSRAEPGREGRDGKRVCSTAAGRGDGEDRDGGECACGKLIISLFPSFPVLSFLFAKI